MQICEISLRFSVVIVQGTRRYEWKPKQEESFRGEEEEEEDEDEEDEKKILSLRWEIGPI